MLERIGGCRVVEEIGSGGMAVIYKAVQESLQRTVAIKALKTSVAVEGQFAVRFEREALSLAALQHENIIHVYDFQKLGGALFIVMEYVEGIDLYDLLEQCPVLPVDVAAIVAMQLARALDYAHYRGVIHRDVKPANVMLAKNGVVKLMDFGIARDRAFDDLTDQGIGLGTPSYMSPEQILGDKLDFRSDIFSLGVVLYQMVCGRKPFVEDDEKSAMHKIRLERYPPPRRLNPDVPWELERILARCMQKRREDRYHSTQELVLALERFIARRSAMHHHARIVLFLRDQGLCSEAEASGFLHPAVAGRSMQPLPGAALDGTGLGRLVRYHAAIAVAMALGAAFLHVAPIGAPAQAAVAPVAAPARAKPSGRLRVVVDPWAEIYVDGKLVDTTPVAAPLPLPEGRHRIELRNPYFRTDARDVDVKRDATQLVKASLVRK